MTVFFLQIQESKKQIIVNVFLQLFSASSSWISTILRESERSYLEQDRCFRDETKKKLFTVEYFLNDPPVVLRTSSVPLLPENHRYFSRIKILKMFFPNPLASSSRDYYSFRETKNHRSHGSESQCFSEKIWPFNKKKKEKMGVEKKKMFHLRDELIKRSIYNCASVALAPGFSLIQFASKTSL